MREKKCPVNAFETLSMTHTKQKPKKNEHIDESSNISNIVNYSHTNTGAYAY